MMSKFKVLIVEDEGNIFDMIKDEMDEKDYEFVRVRNVAQAIGEYKYAESPFNCYVVDLQIGSLGLLPQEMADFFNLEGYAWIKKYVFNSMKEKEILDFKKKTIICSKYVTKFQNSFPPKEIDGFSLVNKEPHFESKVKKLITQICEK